MRILFFIICLYASLQLPAQIVYGGSNSPGIKMIAERPLLVLLSNDTVYNEALRSAFTTYWKFSEVLFINAADIKKYNTNKEYNFFTDNSINYGELTKEGNEVLNAGYKIRLGAFVLSAKTPAEIVEANMMITVPDNCGSPVLHKDAAYQLARLNYIVGGSNSALQYIMDHKIRGITTTASIDISKEISKGNAGVIKNKTLLILDAMTKPQAKGGQPYIPETVLKAYPYKYKVVTLEEFTAISNSNSKEYCWLDLAIDSRKIFFIYDVATKALLFVKIPNGYDKQMDSKDMKNIVEAIGD